MTRSLLALIMMCAVGAAQPGQSESSIKLREANTAATAGDWARVQMLVQAVLVMQLDRADLAEAHRLAGIAFLYTQPPRRDLAEYHFLSYLRIDLYGQLDPALYPPEVVTFFNDVRARNQSELRARRPRGKRYFILNFVPPFGQFQNRARTKGWVIGGLLGSFAIANVTTVLLQRSWCTEVSGPGGSSRVCDGHVDGARTAYAIQVTSGIGLILTYVYGVYDGVRGYRRETRMRELMPYASPTNQGGVIGVHGTW
jgi:hypothetical protein